jgi:hypothetical protein
MQCDSLEHSRHRHSMERPPPYPPPLPSSPLPPPPLPPTLLPTPFMNQFLKPIGKIENLSFHCRTSSSAEATVPVKTGVCERARDTRFSKTEKGVRWKSALDVGMIADRQFKLTQRPTLKGQTGVHAFLTVERTVTASAPPCIILQCINAS